MENSRSNLKLLLSLATAAGLWIFMFGIFDREFWPLMIISAGILWILAYANTGFLWHKSEWNLRNLALGIASAAGLYLVFAAGNQLIKIMLPSGPGEIDRIYSLKGTTSPGVLISSLLFIIGPGEEIFWRGYVQRTLAARYGLLTGLMLTTCIYTLIHLPAGNPVLLVAAFTGGLFWGVLFQIGRGVIPCLISHALWDVMIFVVWPIF
jgi:uncharacterized protein